MNDKDQARDALRSAMRRARMELSPEQLQQAGEALRDHICELPEYAAASEILSDTPDPGISLHRPADRLATGLHVAQARHQ